LANSHVGVERFKAANDDQQDRIELLGLLQLYTKEGFLGDQEIEEFAILTRRFFLHFWFVLTAL
jgi:hypothetical protein